jgi:hypothetical protein
MKEKKKKSIELDERKKNNNVNERNIHRKQTIESITFGARKNFYAFLTRLTAVQYSCIGCDALWCFDDRPEKKHVWHMSKLKHFKQRYLQERVRNYSLIFSTGTVCLHEVLNPPKIPETESRGISADTRYLAYIVSLQTASDRCRCQRCPSCNKRKSENSPCSRIRRAETGLASID